MLLLNSPDSPAIRLVLTWREPPRLLHSVSVSVYGPRSRRNEEVRKGILWSKVTVLWQEKDVALLRRRNRCWLVYVPTVQDAAN